MASETLVRLERPIIWRTAHRGLVCLLLGLATGCPDNSSPLPFPDARLPDATPSDAHPSDAAPADAARSDDTGPDMAPPDAGCVPSDEICNGADDDCDGDVDEAFPDLGDACTVGQGLCARAGEVICAGDGTARCDATPGPQAEEICDGEDNDCDGAADEDFPTLGMPCTRGLGICEQAGVQVCGAEQEVICDAEPGQPGEELCNGLDDDCNGAVDDPFQRVGQPCQSGVGQCARPGVYICGPQGFEIACDADPGEPTPELCNGDDDDCDGAIDEAPEDIGQPCMTGRQGACAEGLTRCENSALRCDGLLGPEREICNGTDDDCDGTTDESPIGQGDPCMTGQPGQCQAGTLQCQAGTPSCQINTPASPELCDGLDNDCDGQSDEAFEGLNGRCNNGVGACRRAGTLRCTPDRLDTFCAGPLPGQPGVERCGDNIDNDCDGATDEGFEGLGAECADGEFRCRQVGEVICNGFDLVCSAVALPAEAERCDDIDNDCDGATDEGFAGLGQPCVSRVDACENEGVFVCNPQGGVICSAPRPVPDLERLDCLDNDCDGAIDEGFLVIDNDLDGLADLCDPDRDGDGRANEADRCPDDPFLLDGLDQDEDGLADDCDRDADGDGYLDTWVPHIVFSPTVDRGGEFGRAIWVEQDTLVIGAPSEVSNGDLTSGHAYHFNLRGDAPPTLQARIAPPVESRALRFGEALHGQGDVLVIGAPNTSVRAGAAYLHRRQPDGRWQPDYALRTGQQSDFGDAINVGEALIIGAPSEETEGLTTVGAVYVYASDAGAQQQPQRLTAPRTRQNGNFGVPAIQAAGGLVIGESGFYFGEPLSPPGRIHIFRQDPDGLWLADALVEPPTPADEDLFGRALAAEGDTLWTSAPYQPNDVRNEPGAVYRFTRDPADNTWRNTLTLLHPDVEPGALFGWSMALSSGRLLVGSIESGPRGSGAGFLYEAAAEGPLRLLAHLPHRPGFGARLGDTTELTDRYIVMGAPGSFEDERTRGAVYIYPFVTDNCPGVANPDQADADGDGVGDACAP